MLTFRGVVVDAVVGVAAVVVGVVVELLRSLEYYYLRETSEIIKDLVNSCNDSCYKTLPVN